MTIPKFIFLLSLFCSLTFPAISQTFEISTASSTIPAEEFLLHTDRSLYLIGETIWFKVYVFEKGKSNLSKVSKVGYLELISPDGIAISRVKIGLEEGKGMGTIDLPQGISNGEYRLQGYTRAMRNFGNDFFGEQSLVILNPAQPIVEETEGLAKEERKFLSKKIKEGIASKDLLGIEINGNQSPFSQRSLVTLEIITKKPNGQPVAADLSLSISLKSPENSPSGLFQIGESIVPDKSPKELETIPYSFEEEGMHISGKVINKNTNEGLSDASVYIAFPGKTALVYSAKTDSEGQFSYLLPKLFGLKQVVIQAIPNEPTPLSIQLTDEFHPTSSQNPAIFMLPSEWKEYAQKALINAQIGKVYSVFDLDPTYQVDTQFTNTPFFGTPELNYRLDDYTRFPLPEFFFEIVPLVRVRGKFGKEELTISNEWTPRGSDNVSPLLLVDGVPLFDQNTFLKINNKLIESAQVITNPFWLNPGIFNGIIQITSFEGDARSFELPEDAYRGSYLTLLPKKNFSFPDYGTIQDRSLPDFRTTLYWNPSIQTDTNGKATISFYSSDTIGDYEIRVEGIGKGGLHGSSNDSTLEVVKIVK